MGISCGSGRGRAADAPCDGKRSRREDDGMMGRQKSSSPSNAGLSKKLGQPAAFQAGFAGSLFQGLVGAMRSVRLAAILVPHGTGLSLAGRLLPFAIALMASNAAWADENGGETMNTIRLEAEAEATMDNDEMLATLTVMERGLSRDDVINAATKKLNDVFTIAKGHPEVKVAVEHRGAWPEYQGYDNPAPLEEAGEEKAKGSQGKKKARTREIWTDETRINVHSTNFGSMHEFLAKAQTSASISDLAYSISDGKKKTLRNDLIRKAIAEFKSKADYVTAQFGAKSHDLLEASVNEDDEDYDNHLVMQEEAMPMAAMEADSAPAMEVDGGKGKMVVRVNGAIILKY